MNWLPNLINRIADKVPCGYSESSPNASEPSAMAALALIAHQRETAATRAADWLAQLQGWDGSVGVSGTESQPKWPTSLAILTWLAVAPTRYATRIEKAVKWALGHQGSTGPRKSHVGHDTTLVGWSWAANTHSWLEPTALFVLALRRAGFSDHLRTREAVRLLVDRLLPDGGANYGNTVVLGQPLLAHIQSTGLALMALANEPHADPRIDKSFAYLERELNETTPTASLSYGLLGLAAHNRLPANAEDLLRAAYQRELRRERSSYKLSLLALAAARQNPIVTTIPINHSWGRFVTCRATTAGHEAG